MSGFYKAASIWNCAWTRLNLLLLGDDLFYTQKLLKIICISLDTSAALTLEKVKATNERPSTGKSTLEKQEENIHNAEAPAPPTVQDEHSIKQDPNIKGLKTCSNIYIKKFF